jgi:hypothetical protein
VGEEGEEGEEEVNLNIAECVVFTLGAALAVVGGGEGNASRAFIRAISSINI